MFIFFPFWKMVEAYTLNRTCYMLIWWWKESMEKRVDTLAELLKEDPSSMILITWYKQEIGFILTRLEDFCNKNKISFLNDRIEAVSYDTVTNIEKLFKMTKWFEGVDKIVYSTSKLHSDRIRKIFAKYYPEFLDKLEFHISGEDEAGFAGLASTLYRIDPRILQYASIPLRPKHFLCGYFIPKCSDKINSCRKNLFYVLRNQKYI